MALSRHGADSPARILVLGGGFAGVYTAFELQKRLRRRPVEIAIVNRENFFVFYPLLAEIVSGAIDTEHVLTPIRYVASDATLYVGEVTAIDLDRQQVEIRHGLYRHRAQPQTLGYDYLVLALGGVPNVSLIPGLGEYAFDVQRLSRAFALRNHLIDVLEQADIETSPVTKARLLTFVIIGGGATGVEVAGEIRDLVDRAARHYRNIEPDDARVILVHSGDRLVPDLPESLARFAEKQLRSRGVEIRFGRRAKSVAPTRVELDDGTVLLTETVVGSVGVQPNPLVRALPLPKDPRGRILVNDYLGVDGYPNVWAVGDNALVIDPHTGGPYPQTAQHAIREARVVAHNIAARIEGKAPKKIAYRTLGQMVALGHRSAVVDVRGLHLSGFPAWWLWRTYYLAQLPRWEKRLRVTFDWTLDLLFPPALVQLKVGQPAPMAERAGDVAEQADLERAERVPTAGN